MAGFFSCLHYYDTVRKCGSALSCGVYNTAVHCCAAAGMAQEPQSWMMLAYEAMQSGRHCPHCSCVVHISLFLLYSCTSSRIVGLVKSGFESLQLRWQDSCSWLRCSELSHVASAKGFTACWSWLLSCAARCAAHAVQQHRLNSTGDTPCNGARIVTCTRCTLVGALGGGHHNVVLCAVGVCTNHLQCCLVQPAVVGHGFAWLLSHSTAA